MKIKTLTICGSLRSGSSNAKLIQAYVKCSPAEIEFTTLNTISALPIYNPDLDVEPLPAPVIDTRHKVREADLLLFSTPEYIHSLPAALKNLLEWLVGDPDFYGKKAIILHANSTSNFALSELKEVLNTMSARIIDEACVTVNLGNNTLSLEQILENDEIETRLKCSSDKALKEFEEHNRADR